MGEKHPPSPVMLAAHLSLTNPWTAHSKLLIVTMKGVSWSIDMFTQLKSKRVASVVLTFIENRPKRNQLMKNESTIL